MIYEALPIPSTNGRNWGVYAVFHKTGLPPQLWISTKHRRDAKRWAKEWCENHAKFPATSYTWRWTVLDDDINEWWSMNDFYARESCIHNPYREGGRVVVIEYGDGIELPAKPVELWPYRRRNNAD